MSFRALVDLAVGVDGKAGPGARPARVADAH